MKIAFDVVGKKAGMERCDLLVAFAGEKKSKLLFDKNTEEFIVPFMPASVADDFRGEKGGTLLFYPTFSGGKAESLPARIALCGLGKAAERKDEADCFELLRLVGGDVAALCKEKKVARLTILVPECKGVTAVDFIEHCIEGLLLGFYSFTKYKTNKTIKIGNKEKESPFAPEEVLLLIEKENESCRQALRRGKMSASAGNTARDMANEPGNGWTPSQFAAFGLELGKKKNVTCTIFGKKEMEKLGMGGILGVNQGSSEPPKLVIVDYCPAHYRETVMFVGKGLTFDSGGISLKPGAGMMDMKYDMCGGAAAISSMATIIAEQPDVRVVCLVPSTDNMPGGRALKPGDIVTHYGGITSEIENTDAEGRLILADALAYGIERYQPDCVIDLATLTGAVIIALGHHYVGVLSNDDTLCQHMMEAGARAGERQWRLPLDAQYAKQLESKIADLKNTGGRPAGTITAAEYLHTFVGKTPWVHLDIAGTAWEYTEKSYIPKGPSGIGTRTLIEYIRAKAAKS